MVGGLALSPRERLLGWSRFAPVPTGRWAQVLWEAPQPSLLPPSPFIGEMPQGTTCLTPFWCLLPRQPNPTQDQFDKELGGSELAMDWTQWGEGDGRGEGELEMILHALIFFYFS